MTSCGCTCLLMLVNPTMSVNSTVTCGWHGWHGARDEGRAGPQGSAAGGGGGVAPGRRRGARVWESRSATNKTLVRLMMIMPRGAPRSAEAGMNGIGHLLPLADGLATRPRPPLFPPRRFEPLRAVPPSPEGLSRPWLHTHMQ